MHLFRPKSKDTALKAAASRTRCPRRQQPGLEALEGRRLLSLGPEFLANTTTRNAQFESDNASARNGISVIVWTDTFSNTDHDIRAQMLNADGTKRGSELVVEFTSADARNPAVAMDDTGNFVVVWQQTVNGQTDILAQRFSSMGAKLGGVIQVANSPSNEFDPDVAMDANGNFVVSNTFTFSATDQDLHARRFSSSGSLLQTIVVASSGIANETRSSVAMGPGGNFVVAYQTQVGTLDQNIRLNGYSAAGTLLANQQIAGSTARELNPSVALDDFNEAVVVYEKVDGSGFSDIKARRVSNTGSLRGGEITITSLGGVSEVAPTVAMKRGGVGGGPSSFVVAYSIFTNGFKVGVTEVSASDVPVAQGPLFGLDGANIAPALSIDGHGNYLLTYTGTTGNNDQNIHLRRGRLS